MKGENKMNKSTKMIIIVIAIIAIIAVVAVILVKSNNRISAEESSLQVSSAEDLKSLVDKVYEGVTAEMYNVETKDIDLSDATNVKYSMGLENGDNIEYAVISEPMINAQPYSFIMAKVKEGVNADEVAKTMSENIDTRKWICVSADKLFATSSGDIVFLVMSDNEKATGVYESFKNLAGTIGEVYEKTTEEEPLPPDTDTDSGIDTDTGIRIPVPQ